MVNDHYQRIETERRGIAESMRLMADEARALEHAAANSVSNARYLMGASASTSRRESYSRIRCRSRSCRSRRGAARRGTAGELPQTTQRAVRSRMVRSRAAA
ncbi:MAG: hypothetical protein E6K20_17095 [Gammaproteobacteria bacterium]|nr:MAG: hypothetical protein E6K20_17095 [Gammaproteobacteria bacterium]